MIRLTLMRQPFSFVPGAFTTGRKKRSRCICTDLFIYLCSSYICFYIGYALRIQGTGFASNTFLLLSLEMDTWISSVWDRLYFFNTSIM